jgi:DNA replication and repair protein RecF
VQLDRLWLTDIRSYPAAELEFAPGLTAIVGDNGHGKTNILEAIGYLATLRSFRGAPTEAIIRDGAVTGVIRAEGVREGRNLLIEAELSRTGRNRVLVNRQKLPRARDLLGALRVSVFSPDDLVLVKGGPGERRVYLDDTLVACDPRLDARCSEVDRVLRQRNALLKQAGGRLSDEVAVTLDVWDTKLAEAGEALVAARIDLLDSLVPRIEVAYSQLAHRPVAVGAVYESAWRDTGLAASLAASRRDDLRRGVSLVGPHRDELRLTLDGLPARTHASQGEQRSLALALRLAAHLAVRDAAGSSPILVLDDVFSELDPERGAALLAGLPPGQTLLSTAAGLPPGAAPELVLTVAGGTIQVSSA